MQEDLKKYIRDVKDFPKEGIVFKDITTLLKEPKAIKATIDQLYEKAKDLKIDKVVAIESRGFMFGVMLAEKLGAGFVPIRKPKKLPADVFRQEYQLEYGSDIIEMHKDAITAGENILLHDDVLATGGTAKAACQLIEQAKGNIVQVSFLIELGFLEGKKMIEKYPIEALMRY
ncbi:MAG: adenine phosphoribosyltransferase [Cytophagales bacterium]|nr:MAG: adenine phosphoribosyltransferase [Cytophagales bacterium]